MLRMITLLLLVWLSPLHAKNDNVSLVFDDAPVAQVVQALADWRQLNLMVAPGVEGAMSLRLQHVPWQQALALIAKMGNLSVEQEGDVLLVYPQSWQQQHNARLSAQHEAAMNARPLETQKLPLRYADATAVSRTLEAGRDKLLTPRGAATVDTRTNSLLLHDTRTAIENVRRWVNALDVPIQQIELSAHIVTINEESLRELGVRWGIDAVEQIDNVLKANPLHISLPVANPAIAAGFTFARLNGRLLALELSALEQENKLDIIASPRLFTSHQQPASIKQGTEIPYAVSGGTQGSTTIEFKEAVLGMEVTPVVQPDGRILLTLHITQNVPGKIMRSGEGEYLAIDKQEIHTQVVLKDGQTLALGGIFQQQNARSEKKVPFVGGIPLLGALFRYQSREQKRRELVIFITPRLIDDV